MKRKKPRDVTVCEAYEGAGLIGRIVGKRPIGIYHYEKRLATEQFLCEVRVFPLRVKGQLEEWPDVAGSRRETADNQRGIGTRTDSTYHASCSKNYGLQETISPSGVLRILALPAGRMTVVDGWVEQGPPYG